MAPNLDISHPLFPSPQQINRTMIDCNSINNNDVDVDVDYDVVTRRGNNSAVVPSLIYGTPTTTTAVDIAKSHIGMKNKPVSSVSPKQGPLEKRIRLRRFPEQSLLDVINAEKGQRYLTAAPPSPPLPPPLPPPPLMSPPELKRVSANYWLSSPNHQLLFDQHQSFVSYCASEERRWSSKSSTKCPQLATMDDNDDGNDDDDDDDDDLRSPLEYQDTIQQQGMNNDVENEVEIELETKIGNESRSKRTKSNNNKTTTMWLMRLVETTNIPIFDLQVQALTSTMKLGLASTVSKVRECRFATEVDHRAKFCLPEYSDEDNNNNEGEVGGDDNNEGQELQQGKGKWWAHNHRNAMGGKQQQQQQQQQQQMRPSFHSSSSISVVTPTPPPKNYHRSSLALSPPFMLVDKALAMMTIPVSPILPRKYTFGDNNSTTTTYAKAVNVPRFPSMSEYHHQQEQHCLPGDLLMSRNCHAKGGLSKQTCLFPKVDQVHKHIDGPSPNERQPPPKNYDSSNSVVAAAAPTT